MENGKRYIMKKGSGKNLLYLKNSNKKIICIKQTAYIYIHAYQCIKLILYIHTYLHEQFVPNEQLSGASRK